MSQIKSATSKGIRAHVEGVRACQRGAEAGSREYRSVSACKFIRTQKVAKGAVRV